MGLNDSYTTVHGPILLRQPLPTIRKAYSLILQEEKQREWAISKEAMVIGGNLRQRSMLRRQLPEESFRPWRALVLDIISLLSAAFPIKLERSFIILIAMVQITLLINAIVFMDFLLRTTRRMTSLVLIFGLCRRHWTLLRNNTNNFLPFFVMANLSQK